MGERCVTCQNMASWETVTTAVQERLRKRPIPALLGEHVLCSLHSREHAAGYGARLILHQQLVLCVRTAHGLRQAHGLHIVLHLGLPTADGSHFVQAYHPQ